MQKFSQLSLVDIMIRNDPSSLFRMIKPQKEFEDKVYEIWKQQEYQIDERQFKIPENIKESEIDALQENGYVQKVTSNTVKITDKGASAVKVMVLGDNRSSFEDDGKDVPYRVAKNNLQPSKYANKSKKFEEIFWA